MNLQFKRSHLYIRWIFLRILAFCFFTAFSSIAVQVTGLYGEGGILPFKHLLPFIFERISADSFINFPSIYWLDCSDTFLQASLCLAVFMSLLALFGIFTGPIILLLWFMYLSIVSLGQTFMSFQWDSLLLETALISIFFAPWGLREIHPFEKNFKEQKEPSYIALFLLRLLCFKLMFFSGICKLASHDLSWRNLTAMVYHYESQPLPTPLSWLTQKQPEFIAKLSTFLVFVFELILPACLLSFSRRARLIAGSGFVLLMILIMLTGNYAFFNWLTIALSICLLDDDFVFAILPRSLRRAKKQGRISVKSGIFLHNTVFSSIPCILIASCSLSFLWLMLDRYSGFSTMPQICRIPLVLSQPLRSWNGYGLFAVMTTRRLEIIVEGSNDGKTWLAYEFKYKPGDLKRMPPVIAPHQPRLDWQMWFASLAPARQSPWFDHFIKCLLEGSKPVLGLLETNPFPYKPPKMIRARIYDYHFSDLDTLLKTGQWWSRIDRGLFYPESRLEDFRTVPYSPDLE